MRDDDQSSFEDMASEQSLPAEFAEFLMENKKFWLIPIILVMLLLTLIIVLGSSSIAPFIYTLW